jgi:hypothetical protein
MKYKKRPDTIEAIQWFKHGDHPDVFENEGKAFMYTESQHKREVSPGDWIITGLEGSTSYPLEPHLFEMTYEPLGDKE